MDKQQIYDKQSEVPIATIVGVIVSLGVIVTLVDQEFSLHVWQLATLYSLLTVAAVSILAKMAKGRTD
jgi:hypothetical protein